MLWFLTATAASGYHQPGGSAANRRSI